MKKILVLLCAAVLCFSLVGCGDTDSSNSLGSKEVNSTTTKALPKTTTTTTVTTVNAEEEEFNSKYGSLPSWKEVKYDPTSYNGKDFVFMNATVSLDDYYNYDYRDTESRYFCIEVEPSEEYGRWYIYADRDSFKGLYKLLIEEGELTGFSLVANVAHYDDGKHEQGRLVDYMYSDTFEDPEVLKALGLE